MTEIQLDEILKEFTRWRIQYNVDEWRIILTGGDNRARHHYEQILSEDKKLQAQLILYAANKNSNLRDLIEERAAIRWADGFPGDLLSAVMCNLGGHNK